MSTITADIEQAIAGLRPLVGTEIWVRYVNEHGVPVKRQVLIATEQVDPAGVREASAA